MDRTDDGQPIKMLALIDVYTKEALAIYPARWMRSQDVIDIVAQVMVERGVPEYIRSDNGPEMVAKKLRGVSAAWAQRRSTSRRAARGKMAAASRSMAS